MPFLRFSRDKRGYEHTYLVHATIRRGKPGPSRVLYWYRTPPGVKVGRPAFDEEARATIELQNPGVAFDWKTLEATPMPPVREAERWRERRRVERLAKQSRRADEADDLVATAAAELDEPDLQEEEAADLVDVDPREVSALAAELSDIASVDAGDGPSGEVFDVASVEAGDAANGEADEDADGDEAAEDTDAVEETAPAALTADTSSAGGPAPQTLLARPRGRRRRRGGRRHGNRDGVAAPGSLPNAGAPDGPRRTEPALDAAGSSALVRERPLPNRPLSEPTKSDE